MLCYATRCGRAEPRQLLSGAAPLGSRSGVAGRGVLLAGRRRGRGPQPGARGGRDCASAVARDPPHLTDTALQYRRLEVFLVVEKGGVRGDLLRQIVHLIER